MKKFMATLSMAALLGCNANADLLRVEMGVGGWQQTPSGYATRTDGNGALKLDGTYTSAKKRSSEIYVWALLKHPVPIIPNLRAEYVSISDKGDVSGKVNGLSIPGTTTATFDTKQYDLIPYYNLLDNTFWITVDAGVDIKFMTMDIAVEKKLSFTGYTSTESTVIPLLYLRGRIQIPTTGLGIESDVKAITDGTNTLYDARAKVDYTFEITPLIQPGIEVGYRVQQLKVDDGTKSQVDLKYKGVYAGVMLRF